MTNWFYERDGKRAGPTTSDEIKELFAKGALTLTSLVWNKDFGSNWRPLGSTELAPPSTAPDEPPPLPSASPPPLPPSALQETSAVETRDFLSSDLTKSLIGDQQSYYLEKWSKLVAQPGFAFGDINKQRSWNWPAFLFPFAWPFYRKLYLVGAFIIALQLFSGLSSLLFPPAVALFTMLAVFGSSVALGVCANALYLDATHKKWLRIRTIIDPEQAKQAVARDGSTSGVFAAGGTLAMLLFGWLPLASGGDLFSSGVSCSSSNAINTVVKIAREQIDKDGYMMFVVDSSATKIGLNAIRTQNSEGGRSNCAATISYNIAFKGGANANVQGKSGADDPNFVKTAIEKVLNKDITYRVEKTDDGGQIYVTVYGLN